MIGPSHGTQHVGSYDPHPAPAPAGSPPAPPRRGPRAAAPSCPPYRGPAVVSSTTARPTTSSMPSRSSRLDQPDAGLVSTLGQCRRDGLTPPSSRRCRGRRPVARPGDGQAPRRGRARRAPRGCAAARAWLARAAHGQLAGAASWSPPDDPAPVRQVRQGIDEAGDGRHAPAAHGSQRTHPGRVERWCDDHDDHAATGPAGALQQHLDERCRTLRLCHGQQAEDLVSLAGAAVGGDDGPPHADGFHAHAAAIGQGVAGQRGSHAHGALDGGGLAGARRARHDAGRGRSTGRPRARCRTP